MTNFVGFFSFLMINVLFTYSLGWKNKEWEDFKVKHNKLYKDGFEELKKMENYFKNKKAIESHNLSGRNKFILDLNSFGDLVFEELEKKMKNLMGYKSTGLIPNITMNYFKNLSANTPNSIDWREYDVVTPVKNQGNCGACWAFSATGSLEGQHALKTGNLVSLSEQNLIDCNHNFINDGCDGGNMDNAFEYVVVNDGIDTEESYPYQGHDGYCHYSNDSIGSSANGLRNLPSGNEEILKDVVGNVGPVSVAIDAKGFLFQFYRSGVFYNPFCSSTNLDHGVLVVGYGTTNDGDDYWIVKNSWGPQWGDNGYIYMARNKNNNCGIATSASYPMVTNST